jgi:hypothetical protein
MDVRVCSCIILSCAGRCLAMGWPSAKESYQNF